MKNFRKLSLLVACLFLVAFIIQKSLTPSISNFEVATNLQSADSTFYIIQEDVIKNGISFPNGNPDKNGKPSKAIQFSFDIANRTGERFFYKIYYQNESYKFLEGDKETGQYFPLSEENFYGSWINTDIGFKEINFEDKSAKTIIDSFLIAGNPRNEEQFFGKPMDEYRINDKSIQDKILAIKSTPDWIKKIENESKNFKIPLDELLFRNATWVLREERNSGDVNHRWKRNPRMGTYSALLVVCTYDDLAKIPAYIRNIGVRNDAGKFVNPFYYFLYGEGSKLLNTFSVYNKSILKLKSKILPGKGIYVDKTEYPKSLTGLNYETPECGSDSQLFYHADFEQFFHNENRDFVLKTIPEIADVLRDEYTINDYHNAEKNLKESEYMVDFIRNTDCPCKTVADRKNYVEIKNPATKDLKSARKENVGIKTRVGYTYGKFTGKIKFPELINSSNVWTGLTNAFWMLYQGNGNWNQRRYSDFGYYSKGNTDPNAERLKQTNYTEIDFEIVKTSKYWPDNYYKDEKLAKEAKNYNGQADPDIMVTTTNWDLANRDPKNFFYGVGYMPHGSKKYEALRWSELYQAITIRTPYNDDKMFKPEFFYYQIEWTPNEIIWRVGPSKDNLTEVGFTNSDFTNIPNNQMIMIMTQEYHLSNWWPPIPFKQELIPFPKNDIVGKLYEITIE